MSSVAESAPKHETVHEVTFDRIAAVLQDAHRGQMMDKVEALTKTAHETMKEADMPAKTGEYENVSGVGVEKASTQIAPSTLESKQLTSECPTWCLPAVSLERGQPMTKQDWYSRSEATGAARSEQLGGAQDLPQGLVMGIFASSDRTRRWTC